jgi:hypothetical protein
MAWIFGNRSALSSEPVVINSYDGEHTSSNPYCGDLSCWCHTDVDYHSTVTGPFASDAIDTDVLYSFLGWENKQ